ncbi:MAG: hypothetical protein A3G32_09090 [Deltaproteobacteria bacterium RIFCSPLOWO2_12_FULL_40_28]|nr:MAG: hypothetical protein A3C45_07945 [Deltaproteobacteria bacterium RIFCSPHIGHO2_02_FULL_40_28]OGQ21175.1 MAG: hypothetical protein A3E27_01580 [Deltaproteobacteria bacterium RIFCSPHIGHO2_12_FULL_40_32]OGQ39076.1 MAG: hypothetical protein A3I69_09215 [Deltaproteobacteria bacterium RIFCSPLOWO2_02_FULL_40_36]OGQ53149.1 MAG: hypothetical protein A3G32_09090 [Deltaproteobacteria bacterium RIFCSPLOWO2_12_FULL_40_28]
MFSLQELLKKIEEAIQDPEGLSEDDGFHILQGKDYPNAVKRFVVGLVYALKDHVIDSDEVTYLEIWRKKFSPDEPIDYEHLNLIRREYLLKHLTKKHIPDANKINALREIVVHFKSRPEEVLPYLIESFELAPTGSELKVESAMAIGEFGCLAGAAIIPLLMSLEHRHESGDKKAVYDYQYAAALSLGKIGGRCLLNHLLPLLYRSDRQKYLATVALSTMNPSKLVEISDQRFPFFLEDYKMALKKVVETANEESNSAIMSYAQTALRNFEKFFKENQNQSRH